LKTQMLATGFPMEHTAAMNSEGCVETTLARANRLFREGRYEEALQAYEAAMAERPEMASFIRTNIAIAESWKSRVAKREHDSVDLTPKEIAKRMDGMIGQYVEPEVRLHGDVKLIAYYLPQFHPILENDEWWGPGFTEWTNVVQARSYFEGHYQPHIPGELGFYDLRLAEVREQQARLAKEYGIYGFCYYYYWFEGRRILERPLQEMLESGKPDMPFCICWANENWSRRWDGSEHEILIQQVHNEKTDEAFIHDVIPLFKDPRYIRIKGAPLLIVYRLSLMPDPVETANRWRRICAEEGIPSIHLCMAETFGLHEPRQYGFDSAVQFPPHNVAAPLINNKVKDLPEDYTGNIYLYEDVIKDQLSREPPSYKRFPGVMTSWDNTPRKKKAGNIFLGATPEKYEVWLRGAIDYVRDNLPEGERLVFINAWNEWAEGAHLEPDRKYGRQWLEATRRALTGQTNWSHVLDYAEKLLSLSGETKRSVLNDLRCALQRLSYVNERLIGILGEQGLPKYWTVAKAGIPGPIADLNFLHIPLQGHGTLEQVNHRFLPVQRAIIEKHQKCLLSGWCWCEGHTLHPDTVRYVMFINVKLSTTYYALVHWNIERSDVMEQYGYIEPTVTRYSGFKQLVDITAVPAGIYNIAILTRYEDGPVLYRFTTEVEIA
jgi:hypothetical protein